MFWALGWEGGGFYGVGEGDGGVWILGLGVRGFDGLVIVMKALPMNCLRFVGERVLNWEESGAA